MMHIGLPELIILAIIGAVPCVGLAGVAGLFFFLRARNKSA